ncbi:MAG: YitT family protein [Bacteroidales bacterium]|nr:YitT family protein [Bacteroidales bacterium]MBR7176242.1 YitT family protein [Bacteroidales bacterium]
MSSKISIWYEVKSHIIITLALFLSAFAWTGFLIPNQMLGGGVTGLATIVYWVMHIPTGITIFVLNAILIVISFKSLGRRFAISTIYSVVMTSVMFYVLQDYFGDTPLITDRFLSVVLGAGLNGVACGLIFLEGSSTGGVDIIVVMINKYRNVTLGRLSLFINVAIISCSYFVFNNLELLIYSYVGLMITSYTMDLTMNGSKQSVQMFIFSSKPHEIADMVGEEVHRGVTMIKGTGWYSKTESDIVMVVVRKTESQRVIRIVKQLDPSAFVSVNTVMGVYGKGFDAMKSK